MEKKNTKESILKPGYHITVIKKGELGEASKILEEVKELIDAENQHCKIMVLCELADIFGAIDAYLEKKKYSVTLEDLITMSRITKRAFINGRRT